jgi:hypothetical protein
MKSERGFRVDLTFHVTLEPLLGMVISFPRVRHQLLPICTSLNFLLWRFSMSLSAEFVSHKFAHGGGTIKSRKGVYEVK